MKLLQQFKRLSEMMIAKDKQKLTLDRSVQYEIKVPGILDQNWSDWVEDCEIEIQTDDAGLAVTALTGEFDQAALIGLLRRLYSMGLPLISVNWL